MTKNAEGRELYVETPTEVIDGHIIQSDCRRATEEDIRQAEEERAIGRCQHRVFFDEDLWMYDVRECAICGAGLGAI